MLRVVSLLVLLAGSSASKWEYSVELISKAPYPALSLNNAIGAGHSPCKVRKGLERASVHHLIVVTRSTLRGATRAPRSSYALSRVYVCGTFPVDFMPSHSPFLCFPSQFVFNPAYIPPDATHSVGMLVVRVSQCPPDYGGSGDHLSWAPCDVAAGTCGDLVPGVGFPFPGGAEDPRIFQLTDADGKLWTYM